VSLVSSQFILLLAFWSSLTRLTHWYVFIVAWVGAIGLYVGLLQGISEKRKDLCWFLVSPLLSHVMVGIAGFLADGLNETSALVTVSCFLLVQIVVLERFIAQLKEGRVAAVSLSAFGISYALHAAALAAAIFTSPVRLY